MSEFLRDMMYSNIDPTNKLLQHDQDIEDVKTGLADITQNKVFIKDFPRNTGETNDNGVFTRAFATVTDNTEIIFEKGKTYSVTVGLPVINKNNIKVSGNGAIINSSATTANNVLAFGTDSRSVLTQSVTVTKGSPQFTMTSVTGINVGDIIMFSSAPVNNYSDGIYGEVVAIDITNKIVTLSTPAHKSFTSTSQYICNAYKNIIVTGLTINCSTSKADNGIIFNNIINAKVEFCKIEGNRGRRGIGFMGINAEFSFNEINGFFDEALIDNRTGYGISICGHNASVVHNRISSCKHCISSAERRFYSTNLVYEKNECRGVTDTALTSLMGQMIDVHANAEVIIKENNIFNICPASSIGMMIRSNNVKVINNTFYSVATNPSSTIKGLVIFEFASENITIKDNVFKGFYTYTITYESTQITSSQNLSIENNWLEYGMIRTIFPAGITINNLFINKNIILNDGSIQVSSTVKNCRVRDNQVISSATVWNPCILFNDPNSEAILFEGNDLVNSGGGAECLRFYNNGNIIKHNKFKMTANGAPVKNYNNTVTNLIKDNMFIDYLSALSIYSV